MRKKVFFWLLAFLFFPLPLFSALIFISSPSDNYARYKKEKIIYLGYAEPAFGVLYDLKPPLKSFLIDPDGNKTKLTLFRKLLFDEALNMERIGYKINFIPRKKGDYVLCIQGNYYLNPQYKVVQQFAKAYFHVEIEKGWHNTCGFPLEIVPYTRPYGIEEGGILWGKVLYYGKALENGTVKAELLSPNFIPWQRLPRDAEGEVNYPILRKEVKLSQDGDFVINFEKPGWWVIYTAMPRGLKTYGNQKYPFFLRSLLWIYVFPESSKRIH